MLTIFEHKISPSDSPAVVTAVDNFAKVRSDVVCIIVQCCQEHHRTHSVHTNGAVEVPSLE